MEIEGKSGFTYVAGLRYHAFDIVRDALQQGLKLTAEREPENCHDENAIALWLYRREFEENELTPFVKGIEPHHARWMLGHIPRSDAAKLAPLIDRGMDLDIYIDRVIQKDGGHIYLRMEGKAIEAEAARIVADREERHRLRALREANRLPEEDFREGPS